jgi:Ser-tRNA(Ala) deacylase AlaX
MTKLIYMEDFGVVECDAEVIKLEEHEDKQVVILDQTCFYPKGGGQDFDQGAITFETATFDVEAVFFIEGEVKHIGHYAEGVFKVGDKVHCKVEEDRRLINTRIHSGGHLLDLAIRQLGWGWKPGKGAHYPHMAFVEYAGEYDGEQKQKYIDELQTKMDELIAKGSTNTIRFMTPEEMTASGAIVPDNLPKGKPTRAVFYDDFAVPCGGTHVKDIKDIGKVIVTNIKKKDGNVRVSYKVE